MLYKKEIIIITILLFGWAIFVDAQNEKSDSFSIETVSEFKIFQSNEIKINTINLVIAAYPTLTYEKIINKHSLGLTVGNSFGRITIDRSYSGHEINYEFEYLILPYYRYHFGKKIFRKFFIETNALYLKENEMNTKRIFEPTESTYNSYGFGGSIGLKFIRVDGWLVDLTLGYIRILNRDFDEGLYGQEVPRIAVLFGKRF